MCKKFNLLDIEYADAKKLLVASVAVEIVFAAAARAVLRWIFYNIWINLAVSVIRAKYAQNGMTDLIV